MRSATTYRSARRNLIRAAGNLRHWHKLNLWQRANQDAKLSERAEQCERARLYVYHRLAGRDLRVPFKRALNSALHEFWLKQKPIFAGRVRARILKELASPARTV